MKIWLINPYGPIPSEAWRDYCYTMIATELAESGHEVIWWTSNFSHHFKLFRSKGWQDINISERFLLRLVPTTSYKKNIGFGRILRDFVFGLNVFFRGKSLNSPDLIIYSESPLTFGCAGFMLARHFNCSVMYHQMDLWPELIEKSFPKFIRPILKFIFLPVYFSRTFIYKRLSGVTALAGPYLEAPFLIAPILKSKPNAVIYNGIDVPEFRTLMMTSRLPIGMLPNKASGEIWAVFAGSLGPSYDIINIIEVAKMLEALKVNCKLVIAGDGPLKQMIIDYCAGSIGSKIIFVGKMPPEQLGALYKYCDIGLCCYTRRSNVEMPDKFYDYTAAGLPIINSLLGEVADIIRNNRVGLQYTAGNARDLFEKLMSLINDDCLRDEMAANSYSIGEKYDRRIQYSKISALVKLVVPK